MSIENFVATDFWVKLIINPPITKKKINHGKNILHKLIHNFSCITKEQGIEIFIEPVFHYATGNDNLELKSEIEEDPV